MEGLVNSILTALMVLPANVHRNLVEANVKVRYICESKIYVLLITKYHILGRIMSEADVNLRSASFRNNSMIHFSFHFF